MVRDRLQRSEKMTRRYYNPNKAIPKGARPFGGNAREEKRRQLSDKIRLQELFYCDGPRVNYSEIDGVLSLNERVSHDALAVR